MDFLQGVEGNGVYVGGGILLGKLLDMVFAYLNPNHDEVMQSTLLTMVDKTMTQINDSQTKLVKSLEQIAETMQDINASQSEIAATLVQVGQTLKEVREREA